jgi:hypothetical protein
MTDQTESPASGAWQSLWIAGLAVGVAAIASGFLILSRADRVKPHVAEFACPDVGTVLTHTRPLALSADSRPLWRSRMLERDGFACRFSHERGEYWLYAGLTESPRLEWRAAAEELWPLKVGNATHARFAVSKQIWSVDYKVVAFEKYTARLGTYDTFKIEGTLKVDGRLVFYTTRWWSPDLGHVLSFRMVHTTSDSNENNYWEISAIGERDG